MAWSGDAALALHFRSACGKHLCASMAASAPCHHHLFLARTVMPLSNVVCWIQVTQLQHGQFQCAWEDIDNTVTIEQARVCSNTENER